VASIVKSLREAAKQVGVSEHVLRKHKQADGFPDTSAGYDVVEIIEWISKQDDYASSLNNADESNDDVTSESNAAEQLVDHSNQPADQTKPAPGEPDPEPVAIRYVTIEIPIAEPTGYLQTETLTGAMTTHLDTHVTDPRQLIGLRYAHMGATESHCRLGVNNKHVDTRADLLKLILEKIGTEVEKLTRQSQASA